MNRVVLCGRLVGRPRMAYTIAGVAVASLRIQVPREGLEGLVDEIECVAFRETAEQLQFWGERGHRVNLQGTLRFAAFRDSEGDKVASLRVHVDHGYFVDPVTQSGIAPFQALPPLGNPAQIEEIVIDVLHEAPARANPPTVPAA